MPVEGDHRHCKVCGRVTKPDSETCGKECAGELTRRRRSRQNLNYLLYGAIAILLIAFLSSYLR